MKKLDYSSLKQIYLFVKEINDFNKLNDFRKSIVFLESIHEGLKHEFKIESGFLIKGKFGKLSEIDLSNAPQFINQENFLEWICKKLN